MVDEFVKYWTEVAKKPEDPWYSLAKKMVDYPKIVFTKTLDKSLWPNTILAKGDIVDEVNRVKTADGKDIIVYGGVDFVSSLVSLNLIDEYHLIVNPIAIGAGLSIFKERKVLELQSSVAFKSGKIVNKYIPVGS